jgi:hypothetical protein
MIRFLQARLDRGFRARSFSNGAVYRKRPENLTRIVFPSRRSIRSTGLRESFFALDRD